MTEIPAHLLERTRSRRRALGLPVAGDDGDGGGGGGEVAAAGGAAPAVAADSLPKGPKAPDAAIEAAPEAPKPVPAYIEAARSRKKIPLWATPLMLALVPWSIFYAGTLEPAPTNTLTVLAEGEVIYNANCASCHGGTGGGGVGPALSDGAVLATYEDPADQVRWVYLGSTGGKNDDGTYGDRGTVSKGGMPAFGGQLSALEIISAVLWERQQLSGEDPAIADYHNLLDEALLEELHEVDSGYDIEHVEEILHEMEIQEGIGAKEEGEAASE